MKNGRWSIVMALILMVLPGAAVAQEEEVAVQEEEVAVQEEESEAGAAPSTDFEKTVEFAHLKVIALDGMVGEVDLKSVEFTVANKKSGGVMGFGGSDTEIEAVITTRLTCATAATTKWKLDMMVEFLDEDGNLIDRVTNSDSIKKNEKKIDFKHTTLRWALSHIKEARVSVAAKQ
jgi:hypothetical protein